jgi:DNA-binding Lrp family transcriptional regulator
MDIRNLLSAEKHYINVPIPLFQYLCGLNISRAHEHVFLLHWCEGQISGDWKSKITIEKVAAKLSLSESTVKRAYRELADLGLIRRYSQGRNRYNPMRSDVTITEVTIPDAIVDELKSARNRAAATEAPHAPATEAPQANAPAKRRPAYEALHEEHEVKTQIGAGDALRAPRKASVGARSKPRANECSISEMQVELNQPADLQVKRSMEASTHEEGTNGGRIESWFAIKLRRALRERLDESKVDGPWHEMLWSIGHGSLSEQHHQKAFNVAMKLLRMNRWTTPWDMPDGWKWGGADPFARVS